MIIVMQDTTCKPFIVSDILMLELFKYATQNRINEKTASTKLKMAKSFPNSDLLNLKSFCLFSIFTSQKTKIACNLIISLKN